MSWRIPEADEVGYSVFFNRDESKERAIAVPPVAFEAENGVRYLAPIDPEAGGTWMFVNEHGIAVTLLNWYDKAVQVVARSSQFESRGLLVKRLAGVRNVGELERAFDAVELGNYRAFHLLGFSGGAEPFFRSWDGNAVFATQQGLVGDSTGLSQKNGLSLMSSSSFKTDAVLTGRKERFLVAKPKSAAEFEIFQANQGEVPTAFTPRMNRPDAQTWSRSRVDVTADEIHFKYVEELPDLAGEGRVYEAYLQRS